ncbi:DUF6691 family protein [Chromobacterium violaceum]
MKLVSAFLAGLMFGIGLIVAGMANPAKVLGFLDLAGRWDPSLALVMAGAVAAALPAFAVAKRRERAWLGEATQLPAARGVDRRLLLGSLVFGAGWGLAGVCPGPALVLAGSGLPSGLLFLAAMLAGMWVQRVSAR